MLKKFIVYLNKHIILFALGLSLIMAIILRFNGLMLQSYWFDELFSARVSNPTNNFISLYEYAMHDVHPPFYQMLLWAWYHIFGYTEYSGRALAATVGSLGIFYTYVLGKEFYNREVGVYASFLAATNYFLIYYSQEVRANILLYLFAVLSYIYFIRLLKTYSKRNLFFYILYSILMIYSHYFGFFLVATQLFVFFYYMIKEKENRKTLLILAGVSSVSMLILLIPLLHRIFEHINTDGYWMDKPTPLFFIEYMKNFVLSPFLHKIFFGLFLFVVLCVFVDKRYKTSTITLLIWIIIGFFLPYIKSITGFSILIERNMIIILPAYIILLSYGIYRLKYNGLKIGLTGVIIFFALYHIYRMGYYEKITKDQFRETLHDMVKINKTIPVYDFVYKGNTFKTQAQISNIKMDFYSLQTLKTLKKQKRIPSCFWVAHGHIDALGNTNILKTKGMKKIMTIDNFQAQAFLYAYKSKSEECLKDENE